jgi:hypothetical protein
MKRVVILEATSLPSTVLFQFYPDFRKVFIAVACSAVGELQTFWSRFEQAVISV